MKTTLVELAYKLMENNKADKLQIIYNGVTERSVLGSFTFVYNKTR